MRKNRISVQDLVDLMVENRSISQESAEEFIKVLLSTIEDALTNGEPVKVKGLGTFNSKWNEPSRGVDENTGEEIAIDGYYKVVFIPEDTLQEAINEPFAHLEPVELESRDEKVQSKLVDGIEFSQISNEEEPLHVFEEQAEEIKELLNEINSLSSKKTKVTETEEKEKTEIVEVRKQEEVQTAENLAESTDSAVDSMIVDEETEDVETQPKTADHVQELDDFSVVRDLSLLISGDKEETEKEKTEYVAEKETIDEEVDNVELINELKEEDKDNELVDIEPISDTEIELSQEDSKEYKSEIESTEEVSDDKKDELIVEEPILIPGFHTGIKIPEEKKDITTSTDEPNEKPKLTKAAKNESKSKMPRILIYLLILIALMAIAWFIINLHKYSEFKSNQKKIENLMDSTTKALKIKAISDSLARRDNAFTTLDSLNSVSDSINFTIDSVKKTSNDTENIVKPVKKEEEKKVEKKNDEVVSSSVDIFSTKRSYNTFIATERMTAGSRLTVFAKKYYGNAVFWVYIYEANKSKISNPNKVPAGIEIKIPKLDPKLIDTNNKECIEYAKKLQSKYLSE